MDFIGDEDYDKSEADIIVKFVHEWSCAKLSVNIWSPSLKT